MSDKQFSVDDILNEYSKKQDKKPDKTPKPSFDLDEFLDAYSVKGNHEENSKKFVFDAKEDDADFETIKSAEPDFNSEYFDIGNKKDKSVSEKKIKKQKNNVDFELKKSSIPFKNKNTVNNEKNLDDEIALSFGNKLDSKVEGKPVKPISNNSGNTEIIEGLIKMKRERVSSRTTELTPINRKNINDIDLDIKSKIIPKTEQMSITQMISEEEKMEVLSQNRHKKIRDFILSTAEDDEIEGEVNEEKSSKIDDFDSFEDAPNISKEIIQLKGLLIVRFCFLLIAGILSTYIAFANDFKWAVIDILNLYESPNSFLFISVILGLFSAFVSSSVIANGIKNFYRLNADADSLSAFAILSSLVASTVMLIDPNLLRLKTVHIYIPVAIMSLLFNTLGKIVIINRTERNFKFVSGDNEKYALFQVTDENTAAKFTKGALRDFPSLSSMKKTEFVSNFLNTSYEADLSDVYCKYSVPVTILVGLFTTLLSIILNNSLDISSKIFVAFSTFAGTIAICSSFCLMLVISIPLSKASKKYLESSACLIGYPAVEDFSDTNSLLVGVEQLFPEGMVDLVNLKQLSSTSIEEGILIAASLSCQAGSILKSTFFKMLRGKTEMLYPVESYIYEDTLGLSGWIENKRVLLGTRELMVNHSIEGLPSKAKEREYVKNNSQILYLSVSGEVTTIFVVQINASHGISKWLKVMEKENITVVLRSVDSIISLNFLSEIFNVSPDCFKLIPFRFHKSFDEETTYVPKITSSMVCSGKFQSFAMLIAGTKRLSKTAKVGVSLLLASTALGAILAIVLTALSSFSQLSASLLILYNLAWLVFTLSIQASRKV